MFINIVEDDINIRNLLTYTLSTLGYEVLGFENSMLFYESLKKRVPDLVLLDIMLPGEDGLSVLKFLKKEKRTSDILVIMLTAKDSEYDKVLGLDGGADDYITKPFGMMELISRIKALIRRNSKEKPQNNKLQIANVILDSQKRIVIVDENIIELTMKEFNLLELMMSKPDFVFTRDMLLDHVWSYDYDGESRTLDVHIRSLRAKLGKGSDIIQTIRGVGYKVVNK